MPRPASPAAIARAALFAAAIGVLSLGGCSCPGRAGAPPPERYLPPGPGLSLVVPEAGRAAKELAALHGTVSAFPGATGLAGLRTSVVAQLGFDPLDPAALADAGLDGRGGLGLSLAEPGAGPPPLLVLPVRDTRKLEALLERLARDRLGAPERAEVEEGGQRVKVLRAGAGAPPALAYALTAGDGVALVSAGPQGPSAVAAALARPPAASLAEDVGFRAARDALGQRPSAMLYAPKGSPALAAWAWARDGLALGASASDGSVQLWAVVLLGERAASARALAARGDAGKPVARLDPDAALALRWDGDLAALGRHLLPLLSPGERAWLAQSGVDPERDLLPALGSGAAAVVSLSPTLDLEGLSGDDARRDPLRLVRFELVAGVREPERLCAALSRLSSDARPSGAALAPPRRRGAKRDLPAPAPAPEAAPPSTGKLVLPSGEVAWAVVSGPAGATLAVAGGPEGALERLQARLAGGGRGFTPPTKASGAALSDGLAGAVLDPQRLVASVRALPDEAFGTGPSGFVVRSVVERVLDPAARLAAVSGKARLTDAALVIGVTVEARADARGEGASR